MEKLWSPWRSQYIDSIKEKHSNKGCFLCEAAKVNPFDIENLLVYKGKFTFTILNLYPYNNGHLMVVPNRHLSDFTELTEEENNEIMLNLQKAQKALTDVFSPEGFNVGANLGKVSGAGIDDHIHFHIVPRWNGDTNFMPVLGEVKIISQDLFSTKKKLLEAYSKLK
ncbi:MAG TPA: HIT domain-containing protein [Ignavibacteriaceae bacterium]|nr:HIT domain-containing protein [Ignavibacteriaceae bacterium]